MDISCFVDVTSRLRFFFILRYGEKNNAFIVASFENEDENKDEISKKVTKALDKVTSDYHSGSSSSDEETSKEVEVKPNSVTATPSPVYQVTVKQFHIEGPWAGLARSFQVVPTRVAQGFSDLRFWITVLCLSTCSHSSETYIGILSHFIKGQLLCTQ